MSKRIEAIKRLAETDPYWKGYIDGMNRTREADATEYAEYARLMQARIDRNTDTTDYDAEWTRNTVALNPRTEEYRRTRAMLAAMLERMEPVRNARATPNAADLGAPRIG